MKKIQTRRFPDIYPRDVSDNRGNKAARMLETNKKTKNKKNADQSLSSVSMTRTTLSRYLVCVMCLMASSACARCDVLYLFGDAFLYLFDSSNARAGEARLAHGVEEGALENVLVHRALAVLARLAWGACEIRARPRSSCEGLFVGEGKNTQDRQKRVKQINWNTAWARRACSWGRGRSVCWSRLYTNHSHDLRFVSDSYLRYVSSPIWTTKSSNDSCDHAALQNTLHSPRLTPV